MTLHLTRSEFAIFDALANHRGTMSAAELAVTALGYPEASLSLCSAVREHISSMRRKGWRIANERGHGYYLVGSYRRIAAPENVKLCPECGARFLEHTHPQQMRPWTECPEHRGARYDTAKRELDAARARWRAAGYRRAA